MAQPQTIVINNFGGRLTRVLNGDLNSGLAKFATSFGYNPFTQPNNLVFYEAPVQIDSGAAVVTDLILKFKDRVESGTPYVYSYGYNGKFYKTTLSTDTPVLVTSLTSTATMKFGGGMAFYTGASEKVWIGHDTGLLKMGFDGSAQTTITTGATWVASVPRPIVEFLGKLYVGNDTNLVQIDNTELVTNGTLLSPTIPANFHIVDLDVSPDGRYVVMLCTRNAPLDIQTIDPSDFSTNQESILAYWNGVDAGITNFDSIPAFVMTALNNSSPNTYRFGYDANGAILRDDTSKVLTLAACKSPLPYAADFTGNQVVWGTAENVTGSLRASIFNYGPFDSELPVGLYRNLQATATGGNADVMVVGAMKIVANLSYKSGSSTPNTTGRIYYSTFETGGASNTAKFSKFLLTPQGTGTAIQGVYETQTQLFPQRISVRAIRFYTEPTVSNNSFQVDLIGSDGTVISGSTQTYTFAAGTDLTQAQGALELVEFANLQIKPSYAIGVRITNKGSISPIIHKIELDWETSGR